MSYVYHIEDVCMLMQVWLSDIEMYIYIYICIYEQPEKITWWKLIT